MKNKDSISDKKLLETSVYTIAALSRTTVDPKVLLHYISLRIMFLVFSVSIDIPSSTLIDAIIFVTIIGVGVIIKMVD